MLLLDTYAFLMNYKHPWKQVLQRTEYYRYLVKAVLEAIGISSSRVSFVENSSYEGTKEFVIDHYKLCTLLSRQDCLDTGAEVSASTMFSPMLTPGLQSLAEEYLDIDMQFGGTDQVGHPNGFVVWLSKVEFESFPAWDIPHGREVPPSAWLPQACSFDE